jgi:hypothetical protein
MAKRRFLVEFELFMPYRPTSSTFGKDKAFVVYRSLGFEDVVRLFNTSQTDARESWNHHWNDGWGARVDGRITASGEKRRKSDGFAGYEWMVDNIVRYGQTEKPVEAITA